jgi:hypothetical protein
MSQLFQKFLNICALAASCVLTAPCTQAAITVSIVDGSAPQDTVLIESNGADDIVIRCTNNFFTINDIPAFGITLACNAKPNIVVRGGPLNNLIDISRVNTASFGANIRVSVAGGDGADTIIGTAQADQLSGGLGADRISAGAGDDVLRWNAGDGEDICAGEAGSDRLEVIGNSANEVFFLDAIAGTSSVSLIRLNLPDSLRERLEFSGIDELAIDTAGGQNAVDIDSIAGTVAQIKVNFGPGTAPNQIGVFGTDAADTFSLLEPSPGTLAVVGASVPVAVTGLKSADGINLIGLGGDDVFLIDPLSERFGLILIGNEGNDSARINGDARDEIYQLRQASGDNFLNRVMPAGRGVRFTDVETLHLDLGAGNDEVNTEVLFSMALVLEGGAPDVGPGDALIVQNYAGPTSVSPLTNGGAPLSFRGFERTNDYVVHERGDAGNYSLRGRVADAARFPGRFVTFDAALTGTIALSAPITLGGSISLIGPGADVLELRPSNFGGLLINPIGSIAFIAGLGLRGVVSGFNSTDVVLSNQGILSLNGVHISDNAVTAINNSGDLMVRNSAITQNSGPIARAVVENTGTMSLINTTLAGNNVTTAGVIRNAPAGLLKMINSTMAENTNPFMGGNAGLTNSGSAQVFNSIISQNSGAQITGNPLVATSSNNLIGANAISLGSLQNNGGRTPTLAINENSAAHDSGSNTQVNVANFGAAPYFDQRGGRFGRIVGSAVDIGAFEIQPELGIIFAAEFE